MKKLQVVRHLQIDSNYNIAVMDEACLFMCIIQQSSQYVASTVVCLSRLFCILILHTCPTCQFQACFAAVPIRPCFSKGLERTGVASGFGLIVFGKMMKISKKNVS